MTPVKATAMRAHTRQAVCRRLLGALAGLALLGLAGAAPALAEAPWWRIGSEVAPTYLPPGGNGELVVVVSNLGDGTVNASTVNPVVITDTLPSALKATEVTGGVKGQTELKCPTGKPPSLPLACTYAGTLAPYEQLAFTIKVKVEEEPPGSMTSLPDEVSVEGGGVPNATSVQQVTLDNEATPFGLRSYELSPFNEDGTPATQAGSHPFQLTTTLVMNQTAARHPVALPKDLRVNLPPGLVGNPNAAMQCSEVNFAALVDETNLCPPSTVVGVAAVTAFEPLVGVFTKTVPIFNLVPAQGEPARFGFEVIGKVPIIIDTAVGPERDYGVVVSVDSATQTAGLLSSAVTLWGVPGDPRHNQSRGWECVAGGEYEKQVGRACPASSEVPQQPFLTLPTSCPADPASEPLTSSMEADSWAQPASFAFEEYSWLSSSGEPLSLDGCGQLPFTPAIKVTPEAHAASTPTGLRVDVELPQTTTLEANGLAEADVRETTVTLPEGVELSPSAANGLEACPEQQIGYKGLNPQTQTQEFTATKATSTQPLCPEASKIGVVHIKTPLLSNELEGALYLATPAPNGEPGRNPFNSLVALYLVAEDAKAGVLVKLAGEAKVDESTGRVSTTFANTPQLPFEDLEIKLFGGVRAPLTTPPGCGSYATQAAFTPWSATGAVDVFSAPEEFAITAGANGEGCPSSPLAFSPGFDAQSTNVSAGAFTSFVLEIARPDGEQALTGITMHLPAGLAALLASLTPCQEPPPGQAWACSPESQIGQSTASSGLGSEPYALPGQVYLTSGYDGAPFGLLVATEAKAGPFSLRIVDVRSRINVNPETAAVTITTDPGPRDEAFPTMLKGIPVQLKRIDVAVDRPSFEFNPTNCSATEVEGTLTGSEGASAGVSSPFQVADCASLPFAPKLSAFVAGHASKANGASLDVSIQSAGVGQANIAKVDLQLPAALPSRITTLQQACADAVFDANPAACDEGSVIGKATIHTPVLKSPLSGPAYLVSHGAAALPDVEFVLQGEGITLVLDGKTEIKNAITYSKFEAAPDAPFTTFETELPAGPHSVLTANVPEKEEFSLCKASLVMPTTITAQNGAVVEQATTIAATGCSGVLPAKVIKLTNAQLLAKALKACKKKHKKSRRIVCEKQSRRRYRVKKAAHKPAKTASDKKGP